MYLKQALLQGASLCGGCLGGVLRSVSCTLQR